MVWWAKAEAAKQQPEDQLYGCMTPQMEKLFLTGEKSAVPLIKRQGIICA